jgi:hypothetical protein
MKRNKYTTHLDGRDENGRFIQPYNPETREKGKRIYFSQRNYGKIWEGIKGGTRGAMIGAEMGAILAPGNLTAAAFGKKKLALGLTGAGAAVGAYLGGKHGYKNAVNSWKYKNDPEYAKKVDKENKETFDKNRKISKEISYNLASDFKLNDWIKFSAKYNLPNEILKYIKFYNSWWENNIDDWYDNLICSNSIFCPEFHGYFPSPIDAKMSDEWMDDSYGEVALLTFNEAGDDGWACYNLDTKLYGIDIANDTKSLKDLLIKNLDRNMKYDINSLSPKNIKIIQDFKRHL